MEKSKEVVSYGYYSKLLNKPFDTVDELVAAETKYNEAHAAELRAKEEKKAAADKVNEAYKHYLEVCDKANKEIREAKAAYFKERQAFIDKYHSYHMTYTNDNGREEITINDLFDEVFANFLRF